jgi:hypothetical protein
LEQTMSNTQIETGSFSKIQELYEKSTQHGVGFTVAYSDATMSWMVSIDSVAPSECFSCESKTLDYAIDRAIEWIDKLGQS